MKKLSKKLYGASLFALAFSLSTTEVSAQTCTTAPSCETLGFTKSSADCSGKTSLKCPFDQSKYFCLGDGEGGGGERGYCGSPEVGDVLYSDMTCANLADLDKNKRVIGVIFHAGRRLALALEEKSLAWSEEDFDIPGLVNKTMESAAKADYDGKNNTKIAVAYCKENNKSCPAFEYVSSYKTVGTNAGDWYLPALGELYYGIYGSSTKVNTTLQKLSSVSELSGGTYRSSSEYSNSKVWGLHQSSGYVDNYNKYGHYLYVRPVLAF